MKVREKFQVKARRANSARLSGQRRDDAPANGVFCQRLSVSLTSCDSAEICKRSVQGRRYSQRITQCFCFESGADAKRESNKEGVTT